MLLSSCKWVSGVSGEMKFGILVGGLKTTYHALQPWLDLRIWKSKDFLMYNFSNADQSTAAGHEDPPQTHLYISIPYSDSFGILLPYHNSGCGWPWQLLLIPKPRFSSTLKGLCVPLSPSPPSPFGFPIMLNPHMSPNPLFAPPLAPAWVINYLMESIWCKIGPEWPHPPPGSSAVMRRKRRAQERV